MAEILDIVDEQGRPTGQTVPRAVAHAEGIRHRTSHVWILRRHAGRVEVLLQMRCQAKDSFPGCYDISSAYHAGKGLLTVSTGIENAQTDRVREEIFHQLTLCQQGDITAEELNSAREAMHSSLRATFDSLKDGELQQDNADIVLQLRNAQDQIVKAAESLYVALLEMDINRGTLDRSLTALHRSIQEMELRYELGQISALTLDQVKAGRPSLLSSQATLDMNITNYNMQLELMIGADLTGKMLLQPLPEVPQARLDAMDLEADLTAAREASYDLYAAQKTLEDAEEDYKDTAKDYHYDTSKYQLVSAQHTLQAAQHTYNATIQNFEMNFRTLYMQVKDYQQILSASRAALSSQEATYASLQLKYEQGNLSQNALLDAADQVSAAQESVEKAELDLFSAYNSYCWAVEHGILN